MADEPIQFFDVIDNFRSLTKAATDYSLLSDGLPRFNFQSAMNSAPLDIEFLVETEFEAFTPTYAMRGTDTTLGQFVHWFADYQDGTGAEYAGPGPVVNIIVAAVRFTPN